MLHSAAMSLIETDPPTQKCPACGTVVDVSDIEPLARIACPSCGEKFRVERAFDNFALLETLGVGGMGSVYKARDTRLDRFVALKILRKELSADPDEARRLEHEARATAAVNDPHVVQVFSSGTDHGQFYLVMELVDHGSLDDRMAEEGRVPELRVLETGIQVARGLRAAHEKGLIHRDIKPGNILYGSEHLAKIGHTTSRLHLCEHRLPSGLDLRYTIPKDGCQQVRLRAEVILQPGHVLLPGRQVELAQGDAVDAVFGEQAFGGQDQPVAAVPCIASKRLSLHETD